MITEPSAAPAPPEVLAGIETLRAEVDQLRRELAQASEVWKTALSEEKKQFDELLQHKELAWREQEDQWVFQTQAYERRLEEMKSEYESRLKQIEQNAARALTDLDGTWQRDKLTWGPGGGNEGQVQREELEAKVQALQQQLTELERVRTLPSDEMVSTCLRALDHQITVLYDLVYHYATPPVGEKPSSDLVQS